MVAFAFRPADRVGCRYYDEDDVELNISESTHLIFRITGYDTGRTDILGCNLFDRATFEDFIWHFSTKNDIIELIKEHYEFAGIIRILIQESGFDDYIHANLLRCKSTEDATMFKISAPYFKYYEVYHVD